MYRSIRYGVPEIQDWAVKNVPYQEGDVFCVPLRDEGFVLGVVARKPKDGKVLLGYFFGGRLNICPDDGNLPEIRPNDAVKVAKFGDLSLMNGDWPVVGHIREWDRDQWPMPKFVRKDHLSKRAWLVSYADDNPNQKTVEERCDFGATAYENDSVLGAGFIELLLTRLTGR